jgi:hypothetical protein
VALRESDLKRDTEPFVAVADSVKLRDVLRDETGLLALVDVEME